jgi:hypothetical protein
MPAAVRPTAALRCAACHDGLGPRRLRCRACGTLLHEACLADLGRCPTIGCSAALAGRPRPAPRPVPPKEPAPAPPGAASVWVTTFLVASLWPIGALLSFAAAGLLLDALGARSGPSPEAFQLLSALIGGPLLAPFVGHLLLARRARARGVPGRHDLRVLGAEALGLALGLLWGFPLGGLLFRC